MSEEHETRVRRRRTRLLICTNAKCQNSEALDENDSAPAFCPACGSGFIEFCPNCRTPIADVIVEMDGNAWACPKCGEPFCFNPYEDVG